MRTTISIEDHLLRAAKQRALERNVTLGSVIEDALHLVLDPAREGEKSPAALPLSKRRGGTRPGIDVADGAQLRDQMEEA
jgi:hypothetical protein